MSDKAEGGAMQPREGYESDYASGGNLAENMGFPEGSLAQSGAQQNARPDRPIPPLQSSQNLGSPMTIDEVADLLGCSPWTVRQRYVRQGLPHLRASVRGKLVFFREQIIAWVEKRQRLKGGIPR